MGNKITAKQYIEGIPFFIGSLSVIVMLSWVVGFTFFTNLNKDFVTMKFGTAFVFLVSCLMLSHKTLEKFFSGVIVTIAFSIVMSVYCLDNNICFFPSFETAPILTYKPGLPSIGTVICFLLVAISVFVERREIGSAINLFAGISILGYLLDMPLLYFYIPNFSTAMAVHTAIFFIHIGYVVKYKYQ